jgi:hypothetical protein
MTRPSLRPSLACAVIVLLGPACQRVDRLVIDPDAIAFTKPGEKTALSVQVLDQRGQSVDEVKVTYASSAPDVADVDATGIVHAKFSGSARVTAYAGGKQASVPVDVRIAAKLLVQVGDSKFIGLPMGSGLPAADQGGPPVVLGGIVHFDVHVVDHLDRVIQGAPVQLALGTPSILELQPDGRSVKAIGYGMSAVAVSTTAAPILQGVSVLVPPPPDAVLVLDPPNLTLKEGEQKSFKVSLKGMKVPVVLDPLVQAESSVPRVVSVSPHVVQARAPGKANVIVTLHGASLSATLPVTVLPADGPRPSPWEGARPVH